MNIAIDIDGVIYPWHESLYRYFLETGKFSGSITEFWLSFVPTKGQDFWDYYVDLPFLYWDTTPRPERLEYLKKIAELGTIYYITSRPLDVMPKTRKFFDFYDLPFKENVIFTKDKEVYGRLLSLDFFVDDMPSNVFKMQTIVKNSYLFRLVHNREVQEHFQSVGTLQEFYKKILEETSKKELGF